MEANLCTHHAPEARTVAAKFYTWALCGMPLFVVIDGTSYRREEDQIESRLHCQLEEQEAAARARFGPEVSKAILDISETLEEIRNHERELIEQRLLEYLPQHKVVIEYCVCPCGENDPGILDLLRHQREEQ